MCSMCYLSTSNGRMPAACQRRFLAKIISVREKGSIVHVFDVFFFYNQWMSASGMSVTIPGQKQDTEESR